MRKLRPQEAKWFAFDHIAKKKVAEPGYNLGLGGQS